MFGVLIFAALPVLLVLIVRGSERAGEQRDPMRLLLAGYFVRVALQFVLRDIPIFSYGASGDSELYEYQAWSIARIWGVTGIQYISREQMPDLGATSLPSNLFALIIYLNGDLTRLGCTAVVAAASSLACYNVYRLAVELGSDQKASFRVAAVLCFSPGFLYYTSDMYKDGLVAFLTISALASSFRLSRSFSLLHLFIAVVSMYALWYVRFYLIFLTAAPMAVGLLGTGQRSLLRPIMTGLGSAVLIGIILSSSSAAQDIADRANTTFAFATAEGARAWNASTSGSGITFDDGGQPLGALWLKVLYTLFSPFPWMSGSFALQIGKLDVFLWYYLAYRAFLASKRLWSTDRTLLLMFLVFLVPSTLAYATTVSNVGMVLRQRIPIVMMGAILATQSWAGFRKAGPLAVASGPRGLSRRRPGRIAVGRVPGERLPAGPA